MLSRGPDQQQSKPAAAHSDPLHGQSSGGLPAVRLVSHYRIERKLGSGGMGQVFLATDVALNRQVALKILPETYEPALRERLLREAWASARLQHPAIATFYEAGTADGVAFIAMEYVAGRTLRDVLKAGPVSFDRAVTLVCCLLEGLSHAHAAEILHRDIKPANIICTESGAAKLLDFGLAKHLVADRSELSSAEFPRMSDEADFSAEGETQIFSPASKDSELGEPEASDYLTEFGTILGTIGYMSPEQVRGETVDERSDLFAVGAVLYEALTGQPPFPGATFEQRMEATLHHDPPPVESCGRADEILVRALAKDAEKRYSTAAEFLTDLRQLNIEHARMTLPNSVAVLDFENLSKDDRLDWLTAGLADAFVTRFQSVSELEVVPRAKIASAQQSLIASPSELGAHLGCRWVIAGGFQGSPQQMQISARLIDVPASKTSCESDTSGSLASIFEMQETIVAELTESLQPGARSQSSSDAGPSVEAYECYVRGRREVFKYEKAAFERGYELLKRAVELSPDYALALATLSQMCGMRYTFSHDPQTLEQAIHYAERAVHCSPQLAEPWIWLAYARCQQVFGMIDDRRESEAARTFSESVQAIDRALELEPNNYMGTYFAAGSSQIGCRFAVDAQERLAKRLRALELYQQNLEITPNSCWSWLGIGFVHLDLGHGVEARWCLEKAVELEPCVTPPTAGVAVFLGECLRRLGALEPARDQCLQGLDALEKTDHMYRDTFRGVGLCALGRTALQLGDIDAARAAFRQAVLHLEGRAQARVGGQLLVQALAGLSRAGEGQEPYEQAAALWESRNDYDFGWLWWGWDEITLLQLSLAAEAVQQTEDAERFFEAALNAGSTEAEEIAASRSSMNQ